MLMVDHYEEISFFLVAHGGFIVTMYMNVAAKHFATTLRRYNQPHTMILHIEFLRRTIRGPVEFAVRDVKLGRKTSVIHLAMAQGGEEKSLCYITNTNLDQAEGE